MDAKRVETVSARVDATVSSTGRTVMACFGSCADNRVIYKVSFARSLVWKIYMQKKPSGRVDI